MNEMWKFLAAIGKIPPAAYDAIFPHGPVHAAVLDRSRFAGVATRLNQGGEVSLNPQPLPPGPPEAAVGAVLVNQLLYGAIIVVGGRDPGRAFLTEIEDWCGTGWPNKWPRPKRGEWNQDQLFTGAALAAAHLADQYEHNPEMQGALGEAAGQLMGQVR